MTSINKWSIYVFSVICSVVLIYPLVFTLLSSFKDNTGIYSSKIFALPTIWLWSNYKMAFSEAHIDHAVLNSFLYAIAGTCVTLILGTMASYVLSRLNFKWNGFIYIYFILGLMIPVFSLIIPISRMIGSFSGFNNYLVMIILYGTFELPLTIFLITGYMKGIHKEIDESAVMDGCGPFRFLFRILAPLAMPAISTAGILAFFSIYNDLMWNVILITDRNMYNISMALMSFVGERGAAQMGPTFASISLTIIPTVVVYLLFQEKVEGGLSSGAVKA
ncbi:ABC transporter permease [Paenibacillus baekrokdamisoli]|uniref:ABC transporter permease n=1 Tax=Paenibacillus baekrokdamisoli TaxID=1712516 RepID=A0A3G9IXF9_9BACL|nr:carbohydrate ABC transporter permease [Paenibacillus baekrokdamisoli]MBB3067941.1 raffinose/stachyose/melibiose transport system permease protein [Paenibacillus baekrokdamisoli]BBH23012.1 ABC transporter permease [Paenibacillus baekrokdamisoli]